MWWRWVIVNTKLEKSFDFIEIILISVISRILLNILNSQFLKKLIQIILLQYMQANFYLRE